jgi:hypothetical protein
MTVPPMGLRGGRNTVRLNRPLFALALFILPTAAAQPADPSAPLWLRYPAISPDAQTMAFNYRGRIYTVPSQGGTAMPLTLHDRYSFHYLTSDSDGPRLRRVLARIFALIQAMRTTGSTEVWRTQPEVRSVQPSLSSPSVRSATLVVEKFASGTPSPNLPTDIGPVARPGRVPSGPSRSHAPGTSERGR